MSEDEYADVVMRASQEGQWPGQLNSSSGSGVFGKAADMFQGVRRMLSSRPASDTGSAYSKGKPLSRQPSAQSLDISRQSSMNDGKKPGGVSRQNSAGNIKRTNSAKDGAKFGIIRTTPK